MESSYEGSARGSVDRGRTGLFACVAVGLGGILAALGTYTGGGDQGNREFLVVLAIIAVATAGVFGWVVPRALHGERGEVTAVVLAALGLLTVAVFWSGLPPVLALGGVSIGLARWDARRRMGLVRTAVALGLAAIVLDVAVYLTDLAF